MVQVCSALSTFESLPTPREQRTALQPLFPALAVACSSDDAAAVPDGAQKAIELLAELLFAPNAKPFNAHVLAGLESLPPQGLAAAHAALKRTLQQGAVLASKDADIAGNGISNGTAAPNRAFGSLDDQFAVVNLATSLLAAPAHKAVAQCSWMPIASVCANILETVVVDYTVGSAVGASVHLNEAILDVLSLLHALFSSIDGVEHVVGEEEAVVVALAESLLTFLRVRNFFFYRCFNFWPSAMRPHLYEISIFLLQNPYLPKETLTTAAAALYAVSTYPAAPAATTALLFAQGVVIDCAAAPRLRLQGEQRPQQGTLAAHLSRQGSTLPRELSQLPAMSVLCMLRAMLHCVPQAALVNPMRLLPVESCEDAIEEEWCLLTDGLLCTLCEAVVTAPSSSARHQALAGLSICLKRIAQQAKQDADLEATEEEHLLPQRDSFRAELAPLVVEESHVLKALNAMWAFWDDAESANVRLVQTAFGHLLAVVQAQEGPRGTELLQSIAANALAMRKLAFVACLCTVAQTLSRLKVSHMLFSSLDSCSI